MLKPAAPLSAILASLLAVPASAETFRSAYTVYYIGIPIAQSKFTSTIDNDRFTIEGELASSGIGSIFDSTKGKITVSGAIAADRATTERFRMDYTSGKKKKRTELLFKDGTVVKTENVPKLKNRNKDKNWAKLTPEMLKAVSDPISATLVKAKSLEEVCSRPIKVFDGEMRADLRLMRGEAGEWNGQPTITCAVKFVPVAGYKTNKKSLQYLRDEAELSIEFTALGSTGIYAPVAASIGTQIGTVTVAADALGTD